MIGETLEDLSVYESLDTKLFDAVCIVLSMYGELNVTIVFHKIKFSFYDK